MRNTEESREAFFAMLDALVKTAKDAWDEGRSVEVDIRAGIVETEPVNNYVSRKATGEKFIHIYIAPPRWKP